MADLAFDPDALQRMPRFGAVPDPVYSSAGWSALDGPRAAPTAGGRVAAAVPTLARGASAVGRFGVRALPVAGTALAVGNEALDTIKTGLDPSKSALDVATRGAEGVGRLATAGVGAGLGTAIGGPLGALVGGTLGYFAPNAIYAARDWAYGRGSFGATPTATPAAPPPPRIAAATGNQAQVRAADNAVTPALYPAGAPNTAMTSADISGTVVPSFGTGAFRNSRGEVTMLDSRGAITADAAAPAPYTGRTANGLPDVGGFFGATARLREISQNNASRAATAKMLLQYGGTGAKNVAEANNAAWRTAAAQAHLQQNPGDFAGAAAVAAGRAQGRSYTVASPSLEPGKPVDILNSATGRVQSVMPTRVATEADVAADMKKTGKSRAQVLEAYRNAGHDVSRLRAQ